MSARWYALRSKPHKEDALYRHAVVKGFTLFYPSIRVQRVNRRARTVVPYFPSYLFVYVDLTVVGSVAFEYMQYAAGLVSFGGEPAVIDLPIIEAIRERVAQLNQDQLAPCNTLNSGDQVQIIDGPFAGYEAIFDSRLNGGERVRVLLTLLSERRVPAEIHIEQIQPLP